MEYILASGIITNCSLAVTCECIQLQLRVHCIQLKQQRYAVTIS